MFTLIGFTVMFYLAYKEWIEPREKQWKQRLKDRQDKKHIEYHYINIDQYLSGYDGNMFMSAEDKQAYMHSNKWKNLKKYRMIIANNKCEVLGCNETDNLQLHHITYENLGDEDINDVRIVCGDHHQQIHDKLGYDRTTEYPITII